MNKRKEFGKTSQLLATFSILPRQQLIAEQQFHAVEPRACGNTDLQLSVMLAVAAPD